MSSSRRSTRKRPAIAIQAYRPGSSEGDDEREKARAGGGANSSEAAAADANHPEEDEGGFEVESAAAKDTDNGGGGGGDDSATTAAATPRGKSKARWPPGLILSGGAAPKRRAPRWTLPPPNPNSGAGTDTPPAPTPIPPHRRHPTGVSYYLPIDCFPADIRTTRVYRGPVPHNSTGYSYVAHLAGPSRDDIQSMTAVVARWFECDIMPSRLRAGRGTPMDTPWVDERFADTAGRKLREQLARWAAAAAAADTGPRGGGGGVQLARPVPEPLRKDYELGDPGRLIVLLGPHDRQQEFTLGPGESFCITDSGLPSHVDEGTPPAGWLLDTGGVVTTMGWVPLPAGAGTEQVLAISVIPHSDQVVVYKTKEEAGAVAESELRGSVHLWQFPSANDADRLASAARQPPSRIKTLCFDWGRVRKLSWCPVPLPEEERGTLGLLALLTADGIVRVVRVERDSVYEMVKRPLVALGLAAEPAVTVTAFTWSGSNRLFLGHSDGSVSLWSLHPRRIILRHPVAQSRIINLASAYPSSPYVVVAVPIGGLVTIVDFANGPSTETTACPTPTVQTQSGTLAWNDHVQSFLIGCPTSAPLNQSVVMMAIRQFPISRCVLKLNVPLMCLSLGAHPFLLTGLADGTLWCSNPLRVTFAPKSLMRAMKMCVFAHEFRPAEMLPPLDPPPSASPDDGGPTRSRIRGAVRILTGWAPERNRFSVGPDLDLDPPSSRRQPKMRKKKGGEGDRGAGALGSDPESDENEEEPAKAAAKHPFYDKNAFFRNRGIIHDALTRITAVEWNPNSDFGHWAATAMASGLVKVMDLGADKK